MNKKQAKKWIDALRSGEYTQGYEQLQSAEGYCCLGVLCKINIPLEKQELLWGYLYGATPKDQSNTLQWIRDVNFEMWTKTNHSFSQLNDIDGATFDEIADLIQLYYIEGVK